MKMEMITLFSFISFVAFASGQFCLPLEHFKWDCNHCMCNENGTRVSFCTYIYCTNQENIFYYPRLDLIVKKECLPDQKKLEYCNSCVCNDDGDAYNCTDYTCDKNLWNKDGTLKMRQTSFKAADEQSELICQPNSVFKQDCNACRCSSDGSSAMCTFIDCSTTIYPYRDIFTVISVVTPTYQRFIRSAKDTICTPKSQFKEYCNTCVCSNDGLSKVCTKLKCDEKLFNKDSSLKTAPVKREKSDAKEQKMVCKANSQFKEDCNICICSEDGLQKACTMMTCNKNNVAKTESELS